LNLIPSSPGAIQIEENQILVFGGKIHNANTNGAFVLHIEGNDSKYKCFLQKAKDLPRGGAFTIPSILN
jgi:hypothetical protein